MGVLLLILKIVGCVLAVLLLIFFLVLFVPVRYHLNAGVREGEKDPQGNPSGNIPFGTVWASWLFGVFRFYFDWETKQTQAKVLFFDLSGAVAGLGRGGDVSDQDMVAAPEKESAGENREEAEKPPGEAENPEGRDAREKAKVKKLEKKRAKKKHLKEKKENDQKGILGKIKEMLTFVEKIVHYPEREEIIERSLLLLKRLFRAVRPKQLKLDALVGFDDPSLTGYILGVAGMVCGLTGWDARVRGDFGQKIFRGSLDVKSGITLGALAWPFLIYALYMWKHIKIFLKWRR